MALYTCFSLLLTCLILLMLPCSHSKHQVMLLHSTFRHGMYLSLAVVFAVAKYLSWLLRSHLVCRHPGSQSSYLCVITCWLCLKFLQRQTLRCASEVTVTTALLIKTYCHATYVTKTRLKSHVQCADTGPTPHIVVQCNSETNILPLRQLQVTKTAG